MTKPQSKDKYWLIESNSYMKEFNKRCEGRFEYKLQKLIENCIKSKAEATHLKLWTCFQESSSIGVELTLQLTQFYIRGQWPEYLAYRQLLKILYNKIVEWALTVDKQQKDDMAIEALSLGMIDQLILPLLLESDKAKCLPVFQLLLNNPIGTSIGFKPDLTETFKQMIKHKLAHTPLPVIERFEAKVIYEYLAWRYKYCTKPSNDVHYSLALMPEELIAYNLMRDTNLDQSLLVDSQFLRMQEALNAIRYGETAALQQTLLIDALNQVSELEQQAYKDLGEECTPLNLMLGLSA